MPHKQSESQACSHEELTDAISQLSDEVRVLRDVLDEVRELLSYDQRNRSSGCGHSVLKQMALDPASDNWGDMLVIAREAAETSSPPPPDETSSSELEAQQLPRPATPGQLF